MKNFFFAAGIMVCTLLSCSSSKNLNNQAFPKLTDAENYFKSPHAISEQEALAMINGFPKHKYHFTHKKKLLFSWASFDPEDLKKVATFTTVANVKFVLASQTTKHQNYPTVIMRIQLKPEVTSSVKAVQYITPYPYCPPPPNCTLQ